MDTTLPTRITIELEPSAEHRGRWRARTRVEDRDRRSDLRRELRSEPLAPRRPERWSERPPRPATVPLTPVAVGEHPEVAWTPAPYEPGPCTCEDGLCDRDHENE
ncbi:MAG TPA: hypothetical protein VKR30_12945 [Candidatus Limnocylindrales bacterium]|nr:hypothetical protein [Candidatus Limnocylindrales bacterium]